MTKRNLSEYVFALTALSMFLLWLSFPPIGWSAMAWISLTPLIFLTASNPNLGRRHYFRIWTTGVLYWLATFYFIPIPHPALWLGWIVISVYLACYLPVFVLATRGLNRRLNFPLILAAPICWTGLELVRNHLFTGMGLVCLSHTQFQVPVFLQICDLSGGYSLTFVIVLAAAGIAVFLHNIKSNMAIAFSHLAICGIVVASTVIYGNHKISSSFELEEQKLNVALIQGSMDTNLLSTREEYLEFEEKKTAQYQRLNYEAQTKWDSIDLVVWPENGWPVLDLFPDTNKAKVPPELIGQYEDYSMKAFASLYIPGKKIPHYLVGALTVDPARQDQRGSVLFIDDGGTVKDRYYKNHLVMFGEYIPLRDWLPLLQRIAALGKGLIPGTESITVEVNGFKLAPSICFESTVPHYIRNQVNQLAAAGEEPDVLVNLTNDGWFYGTSCLDFHLACNVLRAVEMRKPHLVCANTGFSAQIDEKGRILQQGPRRNTTTFLAEVSKVKTECLYRKIGDSIPIGFACICLVGILFGALGNRSDTNQQRLDDVPGELPQKINSDNNEDTTG